MILTNRKKNLFTVCLAISAVTAGFANDFDNIVNRIVAADPALQTERLQATADLLEMSTENNLENPEISFEGLFGQFGENKYNLELSQSFDWPGVYSARRRQLNAARRFSEATLLVSAAEKRQQAAELVINMINSRRKLENYMRVTVQLNSMLVTYEAEYSKGNVSILDLNKLRIEVADLEIMYADELISLNNLKTELATLCNNNRGIIYEIDNISDFPMLPINDIDNYLAAVDNSPEIEAARAQNDLNLQGITVIRREGLPGFTLGYRFSREEGQTFHGFTFAMSIPAWGNRGKKAAAEAAAATSGFALSALSTNIENSIKRTYSTATLLRDRIASYGQALEASDNIALLNKAFEAGQITLASYIQDVNYFIEAENNYGDLRARYLTSLAMLNRYLSN